MTETTLLACACGQVHLQVRKTPIVSAECHCTSCREASARLQAHGAQPYIEPNGGTRFVLYRKDRIHFVKGVGLLKAFRLAPKATTRRVVASCCETPVFLEFRGAHWLNLYGCLWSKGTLPALDLRTMTVDMPDASILSDDVPNRKRQSASFFAKILGAWVAMGFSNPKITVVDGALNV